MSAPVARSEKRVPLRIAVKLTDPYTKAVEPSITQDVSRAGACVLASRSMDYGERWVLTFAARKIRAIVKVIHCHPLDNGLFQIGLQARQPPLKWLDEFPPPEAIPPEPLIADPRQTALPSVDPPLAKRKSVRHQKPRTGNQG